MAETFRELIKRVRQGKKSAELALDRFLETIPPHPDGLLAAKACALPGLCIFCEGPLRLGAHRARVICLSHECYLAYHRAYRRDRPRQPRLFP